MTTPLSDRIGAGALARAGLMSDADIEAAVACVTECEAAGVETVRLVFPDQHGLLRGKTLVTAALARVFADGLKLPSTLLLKDTANSTVFPVWSDEVTLGDVILNGASDMVAVPDPATSVVLPWSPHSRLILCDIVGRDGTPIAVTPRAILTRAIRQLEQAGYRAVTGLEVEFQVYDRLDPALGHAQSSMPPAPITTRNLTQGWQFLSETRYGEVEPLMDDLRRNAEAMGLKPRSLEIEMGPSQFEFTFAPSDPMTQADRFVLFRSMVKEVCHRRGLHASFMAKPKLDNAVANGWHMHQSLLSLDGGENAFTPPAPGALTPAARGWIAGLLANADAACLLTTPTVNGYKRFGPYQLAPNRVAWGYDNRGAMIRALLYPGDTASRVENRVADSSANPYYALAAQLASGLDGLARSAEPPAPTETPYDETAAPLPTSLIEAVQAFETSAMMRAAFGDGFVDYLAHIKRAEWDRYLTTVSEWEQAEYFNLF